jgi:hypothetical protein
LVLKAEREAPGTAQQPKGRRILPDSQAGPNEQSNRMYSGKSASFTIETRAPY